MSQTHRHSPFYEKTTSAAVENKVDSGRYAPLAYQAGRGYGGGGGACPLPGPNTPHPVAWPPPGSCPTLLWNHTKDFMQDWNPTVFVALAYVLMEMLSVGMLVFTMATATALFPLSTGLDPFIRGSIIGGTVTLIVLALGRWTGTYLNVWLSLWVFIRYWLFSNDDKIVDANGIMLYRPRNVMLEALKMLAHVVAQFGGALLGLLIVGLVFTGPATTSDCSVGVPPALCTSHPNTLADNHASPVSTSTRNWQEAIGFLIIAGTYAMAEALYNYRRYPEEQPEHMHRDYHAMIRASLIGGAYGAVHILWSATSGGSWNFFYWLVTAWYTNDYTNGGTYVWPSLLGCVVVAVVESLYYLAKWWYCRRMDTMPEKDM